MTADQQLTVPPWTLGWRLQRALDFAGISVQDMAAELGVARTTVSGWLNDRHAPRRIYVRYWADRCRVPRDWLEVGELPRVDSNHQPAGLLDDLGLPEERGGYRATASDLLALARLIPMTPPELRQTDDHPSVDQAVAR